MNRRLLAEVSALRAERNPAAAPVADHYLRAAERLAAQHALTTDRQARDLIRADKITNTMLLDMADLWAFNAYWLGDAGDPAARDLALRVAAAALAAEDALAAGIVALAAEMAARTDRNSLTCSTT